MPDVYIAEALAYCLRELRDPENGKSGTDAWTLAWENRGNGPVDL